MVPVISILLMTVAGVSGTPAADEYVFVEDTERSVTFERGEHMLVGKLDSQGEFTEHSRRPRNSPGSVFGDILYTPRLEPFAVYEYRSGRLIKGVIDT